MLFLKKKKAPARNAPVVVRAGSSENRRMSLLEIEEPSDPPLKTNPYEMSLLQRKNTDQVLPQKPRSDW